MLRCVLPAVVISSCASVQLAVAQCPNMNEDRQLCGFEVPNGGEWGVRFDTAATLTSAIANVRDQGWLFSTHRC